MINMFLLIDKKINLIQEVRVLQALSELGVEIILPFKQKYKFITLRSKFGMKLNSSGDASHFLSKSLVVNHEIPETNIFGISKPIIFPKSIVDYLHSNWKEIRLNKFSFAGLITNKRQSLIQQWMDKNLDDLNYTLEFENSVFKSVLNKITKYLRIPLTNETRYGDLLVWNSTRGRVFPGKSWDEAYYQTLLNSKFVLCPNGDYIWSYRFFESILCGAIPVIEESCAAYNGFKYRFMSEVIDSNDWSAEDAKHNYLLAIDRLIISSEELTSISLNN